MVTKKNSKTVKAKNAKLEIKSSGGGESVFGYKRTQTAEGWKRKMMKAYKEK